ncbi:MAG: hypothetical protein QGD90_00560 [Candidatus Hydrogenedentes bacterium]|nr:hypothetical protein [Candidatus Hydrogenedentota bacterium]
MGHFLRGRTFRRREDQGPSGSDPLVAALKKIRLRLGLRRWVSYTVTALLLSATAACFWVLLSRLFPQLGDAAYPAIGLIGAAYFFATAWAIRNRPTLLDAALAADTQMGLRERLTTSLELAKADGAMVEAVHADARRRLEGLDLRRQFPLVSSRATRWVYVPLLLLGLSYTLLPEFDVLGHRERQAEATAREQAVAIRVERIRSAAEPLKEKLGDAEGALSDMTAEIDGLADGLASEAITEKQAMARLANLADEVQRRRQGLAEENPMPKLAAGLDKLGMARELASALQEGRMKDAAQKAGELAKKLREGKLSERELKEMSRDLKKLSEMLGSKTVLGAALAEALAKASAAIESGDMDAAKEAMEAIELSLEDLQSILEQLQQMDVVMASLQEWKQDFMGPSKYCRVCGTKKGEAGQCDSSGSGECCGSCSGGSGEGMGSCGGCSGTGLGLMGPGRGRGNRLGEIPEVDVGLKPTLAKGPLTKGKMLADILQRTAPETGEEPTAEFIAGAFIEMKQEAEQALTQEEIPQGSKEFVRQYFGSLEPETP